MPAVFTARISTRCAEVIKRSKRRFNSSGLTKVSLPSCAGGDQLVAAGMTIVAGVASLVLFGGQLRAGGLSNWLLF
jgi:hypothetical protein